MPEPMTLSSFLTFTIDISDIIFDLLSPMDLVNLCATNRDIYNVVSAHLRHYFGWSRVSILLKPFFNDTVHFRRLQKRTGTLISGSLALLFFGRFDWAPNDLDLYVCKDTTADVFAFLKKEHFKCTQVISDASPSQHYIYHNSTIQAVYNFVRITSSQTRMNVQVVVTEYCPTAAILRFHSSKYIFVMILHCLF